MNIKIIGLEILLPNLYFLLLFLTTLYYWLKVIFFVKTDYKNFGLIGILSSNFFITLQLILRWIDSGHFPLSNLYESLLFLAWGLLTFYTFLEFKTRIDFLGVFISPVILSLVAFTTFSLPPELQESRPLVPALQSNWLFMHVSIMMLSYASLLLGCILSFGYLILEFLGRKNNQSSTNKNNVNFQLNFSNVNNTTLETSLDFMKKQNNSEILQNLVAFETKSENENQVENFQSFNPTLLDTLDSLSYRTLSIGFCFLTLGILSGAVWANETWGTYWSWDPKETWAFITWLIFAIYLHTRLIQGWEGTKPAWIASFGFLVIWVCYLGVNLLGKGLHSYGFLIS